MSFALPRLDKIAAQAWLSEAPLGDLNELASHLPYSPEFVTWPAVVADRREPDDQFWQELRTDVLALAREHGMPGKLRKAKRFEGTLARLLHDRLPITPHEAGHEEVWTYLTCCWLLDVAAWRWTATADQRRFLGDVNRNAFRRLWWRAEILGGDVEFERLGEDELVNIFRAADHHSVSTACPVDSRRVSFDEWTTGSRAVAKS